MLVCLFKSLLVDEKLVDKRCLPGLSKKHNTLGSFRYIDEIADDFGMCGLH